MRTGDKHAFVRRAAPHHTTEDEKHTKLTRGSCRELSNIKEITKHYPCNMRCTTVCNGAQFWDDQTPTYKAPFLTIMKSLEREDRGLSNDTKIATNGALEVASRYGLLKFVPRFKQFCNAHYPPLMIRSRRSVNPWKELIKSFQTVSISSKMRFQVDAICFFYFEPWYEQYLCDIVVPL